MGWKQTTPIDDHMHFKICLLSLTEKPTKIDALSLHVSSNSAFFHKLLQVQFKVFKKIAKTQVTSSTTKLFKSSSKASLNSTWLLPLQSTQELLYYTKSVQSCLTISIKSWLQSVKKESWIGHPKDMIWRDARFAFQYWLQPTNKPEEGPDENLWA